MMLDAESTIGLVVESQDNLVYEIMGYYMVIDNPEFVTYIKLKDLDKKIFLNMKRMKSFRTSDETDNFVKSDTFLTIRT